MTEFAARLPSWLATLGSLGLLFVYARRYFGDPIAKMALLIYATCALVYIASGAVITDPFLALATTWAMVALAMAAREPRPVWSYGFFVAVALGLLAKGPLMLVLVVGPMLPLVILYPSIRTAFKQLPWFSGLALMLLLSVPWYLLAELKTPGFLNYFLVGEHFLRFVDSGWAGDLYGVAHQRMKGAIWGDAPGRVLPLGSGGAGAAAACTLQAKTKIGPVANAARSRQHVFVGLDLVHARLLLAFRQYSVDLRAACAGAFQRVAGVGVGAHAEQHSCQTRAGGLTGVVPLAFAVYLVLGVVDPLRLKTEKHLIAYATQHMQAGTNCST